MYFDSDDGRSISIQQVCNGFIIEGRFNEINEDGDNIEKTFSFISESKNLEPHVIATVKTFLDSGVVPTL